MRKMLLFCSLLLLLAGRSYAQSRIISGTVTDNTNGPIVGVTVAVIETQTAVTTDIKGHFNISALDGQTIRFTYIGAKPYTAVVKSSTTKLNVQLEFTNNSLNEVVVTGYTAERKKDLTGAVTVVNVNDIKNIPEGNPMKALQGRVPGLTIFADGSPNGSVTVRLRGTTTLNDNDPLYIIDGIPSQRGLQEINQNDIESIQVLRDASAATIYGSRAAAGVIIVTTKKGKAGVQKIDFDASASLQYYNSKISALNSIQRGAAYWQAQVNDDQFGPNVSSPIDPSVSNGIFTYDWNKDYKNPILNNVIIPKYIDAAHNELASNTNWFNEISRPSVLQAYNLSISNGTEKGNSLFSIGYFDNRGIIKETRDTKYNLRYNSQYNLFNGRLKIGETLSATYMKDPILPTANITILSLIENPLIPVKAVNGDYGGPVAGMDDRDNPVRLIEDNKQNVNAFGRVFGNAFLDFAILPNLHFKTTYAGDFSGNYFRSLQVPYTAGFLSNPATTVGQSSDYAVTLTWQNQLTYDLNIGKSKFNFLLGEENIKDKYQNLNGSAQGLALSNIDYAYLSAGTTNVLAGGGGAGDALLSYFAKATYSYNDKYLFSATVRRDGSSKFGADNRYAVFPAGSFGWRISQEDFMKAVPVISDLKFRFGYGQTGNQNIANNATYSLYQSIYGNGQAFNGDSGSAYDLNGKGSGTLPSGFTSTQTGNPKLKWETTTQSNIGLDFGLFNNALTGSFDYFIKNTTNILISPPYLAVLGEGGNEYLNGASLKNNGFEALLSYNGNINRDITISLTGNIAAYRNKVTKLPSDVLTGYPGNGTTQTILGRSINSEYGYVVQGIFTSADEVANSAAQPGKGLGRIRYADLNGDNLIDQNDQKFLGTSDPNFTYGLNTAIGYKDLSLSFFFQGVQGGLVYNNYKYLTDFSSLAPGSNWGTRTLNAWTPQNSKSTIPALTLVNANNEGRYSNYFLESASYLKLRNIQLAYNLKNVLKKAKIQRATVYIQASNLLKFKSSSYTGPDPENSNNLYPIPVITTVGVNFSY
ncbi:SusC/RagA family TonB-linked outer membrane protein [Mucilaginibacter sp. FT3.2]|uniref:SusC/RagA family TonB-linked outer membrane protein n=1 Tax=Mucilaginibacter sp. FT3.2 TaxID=2723090 RepID=UPI003AFF6519